MSSLQEIAILQISRPPQALTKLYMGGHGDVIVSRLSADLSTQVFGTYIGGDGDEDEFATMTLTPSGIAVLMGTNLAGFPVVDGAWDHVQNDTLGDLLLEASWVCREWDSRGGNRIPNQLLAKASSASVKGKKQRT